MLEDEHAEVHDPEVNGVVERDENAELQHRSMVLRGILGGLLIALVAAAGFAFHERNAAKQLAAQNNQIAAVLNETRGQVETLNSKLNTLAEANPAAPAAAAPARPLAAGHGQAKRTPAHVRREDPRWGKIQAQLDEQAKQIDATRQDLAGTRTDLQGSIARTHDELVLMQKKGERNYYEFDLQKTKQFQHEGPVGVRLKKANTKHAYADLELLVDDADLTQKHVNLYQPVVFYSGDNGQPLELVINSISKNHIHGYVSQPKYRQAELTAMTNGGSVAPPQGNASANSGQTAPPVRHKLEVPK